MSGTKIKLAKSLYQKLEKLAVAHGYSSPDEYITHILEQAAEESQDAISEEEVKKQLKGLGYL